MSPFRLGFVLALTVAVLGPVVLDPLPARAQDKSVDPEPVGDELADYEVPDADILVGWQFGGFISTQTDGALFGLAGLARWRFIEAGFVLQTGGKVLVDNASSVALTAGFSWPMDNRVRLDLLGVFGARYYTAVGQEVFDEDPGTSATLSYAGALWGVSYVVGSRSAVHSVIGLWASFEEDLGRVTREYSYVDNPGVVAQIFGVDESVVVERRRVIGATRASIIVSVGLAFDL